MHCKSDCKSKWCINLNTTYASYIKIKMIEINSSAVQAVQVGVVPWCKRIESINGHNHQLDSRQNRQYKLYFPSKEVIDLVTSLRLITIM